MQDILEQLHKVHTGFNPPCDAVQLAAIRALVQWNESQEDDLVRDVVALYSDHNGMNAYKQRSFPFRLMPWDEVIEENYALQESTWLGASQFSLWSEENEGSYVGVFLEQPLRGRVFTMDHEDFDLSPRFYNVRSFYQTWLTPSKDTQKENWKELSLDYPKLAPSEYDTADLAAAEFCIEQYKTATNDDKIFQWAAMAMNLLPVNVNEPLYMFMADSSDFFIQTRAIEILGLRKDTSVIPQMEQIMRVSHPMPRYAGLQALADMGVAGEAVLLRLIHDVSTTGDVIYFLHALKKLGYEIAGYKYRKSSQDDWTMVHPKP